MASIATVVTRGYGTFGSVNLLPTLGYGIGEGDITTGDAALAQPRAIVSLAQARALVAEPDRHLISRAQER